MDIGFIGVGHMGAPMVRNLLLAGYEVRVYDSDPRQSAALVECGARQVRTVAEVVEPGGVVMSMVPDDHALIRIVEEGLLEALGKGGVHLCLSTISPTTAQLVATTYATRGRAFVSATVSGRPENAERRELALFYSGARIAKERVLPLLRILGATLEDLGDDVATAKAFKLAVNYPLQPIILALAGAAQLMERYGMPQDVFFRLFLSSPMYAQGGVFHQYCPLLLQGLQARGFAARWGMKDLLLTQEVAETMQATLPFLEEIVCRLARVCEHSPDADWSVTGTDLQEESREPQALLGGGEW